MTALALGLCQELTAHPVLALSAIAIAWAARYLYVYSVGLIAFTHVSPWGSDSVALVDITSTRRPYGDDLVDDGFGCVCACGLDRGPLPSRKSNCNGARNGDFCFALPSPRDSLDLVSRKERIHQHQIPSLLGYGLRSPHSAAAVCVGRGLVGCSSEARTKGLLQLSRWQKRVKLLS